MDKHLTLCHIRKQIHELTEMAYDNDESHRHPMVAARQREEIARLTEEAMSLTGDIEL